MLLYVRWRKLSLVFQWPVYLWHSIQKLVVTCSIWWITSSSKGRALGDKNRWFTLLCHRWRRTEDSLQRYISFQYRQTCLGSCKCRRTSTWEEMWAYRFSLWFETSVIWWGWCRRSDLRGRLKPRLKLHGLKLAKDYPRRYTRVCRSALEKH